MDLGEMSVNAVVLEKLTYTKTFIIERLNSCGKVNKYRLKDTFEDTVYGTVKTEECDYCREITGRSHIYSKVNDSLKLTSYYGRPIK